MNLFTKTQFCGKYIKQKILNTRDKQTVLNTFDGQLAGSLRRFSLDKTPHPEYSKSGNLYKPSSKKGFFIMQIALNTDILTSRLSPQKYLRLISEAGFTHLHWCHQWNTDFLYEDAEIRQIKEWLKCYQLKLLDIHGSSGMEKCYFSTEEYQRQADVELVLNRIKMLHELEGSGSIMMHIPADKTSGQTSEARILAAKQMDSLRKSLDELIPALEKYQTKIAVENTSNDSFEFIAAIMREYPAQYFGITLDTGHANIEEAKGLDRMEKHLNRLEALHLNDNDCSGDLHQPPFLGKS